MNSKLWWCMCFIKENRLFLLKLFFYFTKNGYSMRQLKYSWIGKKIVSVVELCKIVEAAAVSCGIQIVAEDLSMQLITTHTKPFSWICCKMYHFRHPKYISQNVIKYLIILSRSKYTEYMNKKDIEFYIDQYQ